MSVRLVLNPLSRKYHVSQYCIREGGYFEPTHLFRNGDGFTPVCGNTIDINLVWNWGTNGISIEDIQCVECDKIARKLLQEWRLGLLKGTSCCGVDLL